MLKINLVPKMNCKSNQTSRQYLKRKALKILYMLCLDGLGQFLTPLLKVLKRTGNRALFMAAAGSRAFRTLFLYGLRSQPTTSQIEITDML